MKENAASGVVPAAIKMPRSGSATATAISIDSALQDLGRDRERAHDDHEHERVVD